MIDSINVDLCYCDCIHTNAFVAFAVGWNDLSIDMPIIRLISKDLNTWNCIHISNMHRPEINMDILCLISSIYVSLSLSLSLAIALPNVLQHCFLSLYLFHVLQLLVSIASR